MRKILVTAIILLFTLIAENAISQNVLSFFCNRDSLIPCATSTMTLKARTCDIKRFTPGSSYAINPMSTGTSGGCFSPYTPPSNPGTIVRFTDDDKYSDIISLGFNFPFFGTVYNQVVINTNGVITFDVTKRLANASWGILNNGGVLSATNGTPQDLPSTLYDKTCIMGPYSDINPAVIANPIIGYSTTGTAPHRKFVFSFYRIPLYDCNSLNNNTYQMILYESTGIIEVFIFEKDNCLSWNQGRAMIGLQDVTDPLNPKFSMPQGRAASDNPWGTGAVPLNESWRFIPTGGTGTSLLKRVELIDFAGNIVRNGVIGTSTNGYYDIDFPNIRPSGATTNYIVRSVFEKFDDPAVEVIAHDTVNVIREPAPFTISRTPTDVLCNGASTGSITFTNPIGPTFEYSIDGGTTWSFNPVFNNLPAGTYQLRSRDGGTSLCFAFSTATISQPLPLTLVAIPSQPTNCSNKTGEITLTAGGGTAPYQYSIDGGATYQPTNIFSNLPKATYNIRIKDFNNCIKTHTPIDVTLNDTMRLELGPDSTICFGQTVKMLTQTNAETDTFKWTPTTPLLDYDTAREPIFYPKDTTKYKVIAKWGICSSREDSITINVKHKPVPDAGKDTTICYKSYANLKANATNLSGTVNYAWAPANLVIPNNTANATAYPDTTRYFYVTVTDNYGCNFSVVDSVKVTMRDPVPAFAGNDTIAMLNKPHQMEATGGVKFLWTPAAPLNNPFIRMPLAKLNHDQYFEVEVWDDIGCKAVDGVFIKVYEGPTYHLPNAFSPNGDGLNEVFRPIPSGIQSTEYFRIFDRYGTLMFQTKDWMKGWNGTFQGKPALAGTYAWEIKGIDAGGSPINMKGTVILIR